MKKDSEAKPDYRLISPYNEVELAAIKTEARRLGLRLDRMGAVQRSIVIRYLNDHGGLKQR